MPIIRLPSAQDMSYPPARGPVLLLTCMDLRCLDETVQFMDHDGLANRYDHLVMAGSALGALGGTCEKHAHWKQTFFEHLELAVQLHQVKDVYILEHRDCGAYRIFLGEAGDFDDSQDREEAECHAKYAGMLETEILDWAKARNIKLLVKSFLADLRGHVEHLNPIFPPKRRKK